MAHHHDPPYDAAATPEGAVDRIKLGGRIDTKATSRMRRSSSTLTYLDGRERVLGRRFWLHREPSIAATQLVEELGVLGARAWARELLQEVGR